MLPKLSVWVATFGLAQVCLSMDVFMRRDLGAKGSWGTRRRPMVSPTSAPTSAPTGPTGTTIDVEFGGQDHGVDSVGELERPEVVKSERCDQAACHVCQNENDDGCWYGSQPHSQRGSMKIAVKANSNFDSFVQEVFFCSSSGAGSYHLKVEQISNGKIAVYVNNQFVEETSTTGEVPFTFKAGKDARVRSVFVPTNKGSASSAEAKVEAASIDKSVEDCMTGKLCMNKLGDGSNAAYKLRNNNHLQYKCLESGSSSLESDLRSVCAAWGGCMDEEHKNTLRVLLKISGASLTGSSFADKASAQGNLSTFGDPNSCINPAVDDPESWDCECIEDMKASCGGVDEACFKGILCGKAEICQTWKDEAGCPTFLVQKNEGEISGTHSREAFGQRNQEISSSGIAASLDGSLQGKCSQ